MVRAITPAVAAVPTMAPAVMAPPTAAAVKMAGLMSLRIDIIGCAREQGRGILLAVGCGAGRLMATKRKSKGAYMISAVAEMYEIHPQTLRLYEREGLLAPSRSEGNTRLYTDEDLERLEFILNLARDLGVNIAGIAIVLQMRERMEEMNRQMQGFVDYVRTEMLSRIQQQGPQTAGLVRMPRPVIVPQRGAGRVMTLKTAGPAQKNATKVKRGGQ
jgi:MerR family transcriptional regulator/heat shock protein HspR